MTTSTPHSDPVPHPVPTLSPDRAVHPNDDRVPGPPSSTKGTGSAGHGRPCPPTLSHTHEGGSAVIKRLLRKHDERLLREISDELVDHAASIPSHAGKSSQAAFKRGVNYAAGVVDMWAAQTKRGER